MSDVLTTADAKRALKPAALWRNRYRVTGAMVLFDTMPAWGDGEHWGTHVFPSREIAEQRAAEFIEGRNTDSNGNPVNPHDYIEWLGAHPVEGEAP